jgi:hypothetical protein
MFTVTTLRCTVCRIKYCGGLERNVKRVQEPKNADDGSFAVGRKAITRKTEIISRRLTSITGIKHPVT